MKKVINYFNPPKKMSFAIAFDRNCGICQNFRKRIFYFIPKSRLPYLLADFAQEPSDFYLKTIPIERRLKSIQAFGEYEGHLEGFWAISALLRRTYFGALLAPLLFFFEQSGLGEKIYQKIAQSRDPNQCSF